MGMRIVRIIHEKENYSDLLRIGDEQDDMIARYLERGDMYVGFVQGLPVGVCVVTVEGPDLMEVKNLAVYPEHRRKGYGQSLLDFVEKRYAGCAFQLGTGETPSVLRFYERCGYRYSHRIFGFFTDNYDHPIVEEGVLLKDMLYFKKR